MRIGILFLISAARATSNGDEAIITCLTQSAAPPAPTARGGGGRPTGSPIAPNRTPIIATQRGECGDYTEVGITDSRRNCEVAHAHTQIRGGELAPTSNSRDPATTQCSNSPGTHAMVCSEALRPSPRHLMTTRARDGCGGGPPSHTFLTARLLW